MNTRRANHYFSKWARSIDLLMILAIFAIIIIGAMLITTASPSVAERLGLPPFYFANKQFFFLSISVIMMMAISTMNEKLVKRFAFAGFLLFLLMMIVVLFIGEEVKGARRWISLMGFSLQPSEFMKPFFAVVVGFVLAKRHDINRLPSFAICSLLYLIIVALLALQPDIGMSIAFTLVTAAQFFLAGLPIVFIVIVAICAVFAAFGAYLILPHVAKRINSFLNPEENENYQVEKSIEAYINGGLLGKGPGEGTVKNVLPDSHTDFIFAVAGEEFGALFASFIIMLFLFVILRGCYRIYHTKNLFHIYAAAGLLMYFALQSIFNIGVTLHLFPTKGMTLPFISYGGSSILSYAIIIGLLLNFTRHRYNGEFSIRIYSS